MGIAGAWSQFPAPAWDPGFRTVTESKFTQALGKAKGGWGQGWRLLRCVAGWSWARALGQLARSLVNHCLLLSMAPWGSVLLRGSYPCWSPLPAGRGVGRWCLGAGGSLGDHLVLSQHDAGLPPAAGAPSTPRKGQHPLPVRPQPYTTPRSTHAMWQWPIEDPSLLVINGTLPAISVNKGCHGRQRLQPSNVSPERTQEGKNTCHLAAIRLQPLPTVSPEDVKTQDAGPR